MYQSVEYERKIKMTYFLTNIIKNSLKNKKGLLKKIVSSKILKTKFKEAAA